MSPLGLCDVTAQAGCQETSALIGSSAALLKLRGSRSVAECAPQSTRAVKSEEGGDQLHSASKLSNDQDTELKDWF